MSARHPHLMVKQPRASDQLQATPFEIALIKASTLVPDERAQYLDDASRGFHAFKAGQGSMEHWRHIVDALNTSEALAQRHGIAPDHIDTIRAGLDALTAVYGRQLQSWTLRGTEIAALTEALAIWRVQLDFCSRGELAAARAYIARRTQHVQRSPTTPGMRIVGAERPSSGGEAL